MPLLLIRRTLSGFRFAPVALQLAASAAAAGDGHGLRFNSPGVIDLAERSLRIGGGAVLEARELPGADAERIFVAPASLQAALTSTSRKQARPYFNSGTPAVP